MLYGISLIAGKLGTGYLPDVAAGFTVSDPMMLLAGLFVMIGIGFKLASSIIGSDRKSTRLNSSHGYISYAVFCLKKKNRAAKRTSVRSSVLKVEDGRSPALRSARCRATTLAAGRQ